MQRRAALLIVCLAACALERCARADAVDDALKVVLQAGRQGAGSDSARHACSQLARRGPDVLPRLLAAMDTQNLVAANWLRSAYQEVVERELAAPQPRLPADVLKTFVRDASHQGRVRRLVLGTVDQLEPGFRESFIPTLLDDGEFREDAVNALFAQAEAAQKEGNADEAKEAFLTAFRHARDSVQITTAADRLQALGQSVNIVEHMGLVTDWYLVGPFDAPGMTGFVTSFPPEENVDLAATYSGQGERTIGWKRYRCEDRLGQLNLVEAVAPVKEAVAYAYTELDSPQDQTVQLRCGADDNVTVWVNGTEAVGKEMWLNGIRLDRFIVPVQLNAGTNRVLVKICQGPQHVDPAVGNNWSLQVRFCTADGAAAGLKSLLPPIDDAPRSKQP